MKKHEIHIRISALDKRILVKKAKHTGLSLSEYLIQTGLGLEPTFKLTEDELEVYKMLHKYIQNFQNISNMYKSRNPQINNEVRLLIEELKTHLIKFE